MRNRRAKIVFPIFSGYEVRVIFARDVAATAKRLGEKEDLSGAEAALVYFDHSPLVSWLVFPLKPCPDTIAHECSHAIRQMFAAVGVGNDDEAFAYHLGHLAGRVHNFLKR